MIPPVIKKIIQPVRTYFGLRLVNPITQKKQAAATPKSAIRIFIMSEIIAGDVNVCRIAIYSQLKDLPNRFLQSTGSGYKEG